MTCPDFTWDPDEYLDAIRLEVPLYDRLQDEVVAAASATPAVKVLELGVGSGETTRRLLASLPEAHVTGIDSSPEMLERARRDLPSGRVRLLRQALQDSLPAGPFDLVVSALAVHHLDGMGKADLFRRIAGVLSSSGRFVLGDLVVPARSEDAISPIDGEYDQPSRLDEQLAWLADARFTTHVTWMNRDLAVLVACRGGRGGRRR